MTDWSTWIEVNPYLGCKIYKKNLGTASTPNWVYGSPCISTWYSSRLAVRKNICLEKGGTWDGSTCSLSEPPADMNLSPIILLALLFIILGGS